MFRKLISNLAFSPALIGQLGFYARRLRQEEFTRRLGLIFTALALLVQSFAVFNPPESANAASSNDIIYGGISSHSQMMSHYDNNTQDFHDLMNSVGITRAELNAASLTTVNSKNVPYSFGRNHTFSYAQGERPYTFPTTTHGPSTVYYKPLHLWDTTDYSKRNGSNRKVFQGHSAVAGKFWVILNCGNLALENPPRPYPCPTGTTGQYPYCEAPKCPLPGKTHLPANDPGCSTPPPTPTAVCKNLTVSPFGSRFLFKGSPELANGATVTKYTYTVKKDGRVIDTLTTNSTQNTNSMAYSQTESGTYQVSLSIDTSLGAKSGPDCVKSFTVPPPAMCPLNPKLKLNDPLCQPCPGDDSVWIKDSKCVAEVIETKEAVNVTQGGVDATTTVAKASDRIIYTVTAENKGLAAQTRNIEENLSDVLEYATIVDQGGGVYNKDTGTLTWENVALEPGAKQSRKFMVQVHDEISAMSQGASDNISYDCTMLNTFGNSINIAVDCPAPKQVEAVVGELPQTGTTENMIFAGTLFAIVVFFYARSRQLKTEVRLIRRDFTMGTI